MNNTNESTTERSIRKAVYLAVGHFVTDLYPAFLPALLPLLIDKFKISFTSAGLLAMILSFSASLTQPLFGFLFDRLPNPKLFIWAPVIGALSLSTTGLIPHYGLLIPVLILGGLGAACFHPEAATLVASQSGSRKTFGMSVFMLGGNLGYSLGPFLILAIVTRLGLSWSLIASLPAFGVPWLLNRTLVFPDQEPKGVSIAGVKGDPGSDRRLKSFVLLLSGVVLRVTTSLSLITFLPMIQTLRGFSLFAAGTSNTVFLACGAFGGLVGGYVADRLGRRNTILVSFLLAIPSLFTFLYLRGWVSFLVLALSGFFIFLSEPSCIVLAQELVPQQARMASGLIMGMAWGLAGFGILGTGALADAFGIEWALRLLLLLPVGSLILAFLLPRDVR